MKLDIPDFKAKAGEEQVRLGEEGVAHVLEAGRAWDLAPALRAGGALIFPHFGLGVCGHQIAAAVHACLDSGAGRVLVLGVLHALTQELEETRARVAQGGDPRQEPTWGIQGPGLPRRQDWRDEFSLDHFLFLWQEETRHRGMAGPELVVRYPFLAGGHPEILPGIEELREVARNGVVVATIDPVHHGIGYGHSPAEALAAEAGGLELARRQMEEGLALLRSDDYWGYHQHCVAVKSDGRDVGQVLRYLLGPLEGRVLDLTWEDMAPWYRKPAPTWVAGALVELRPAEVESRGRPR